METPPIRLDLNVAQVSIVFLSLKRSVFMGEEGVYNVSINTMKEMEKRGWIGFSQNERLSPSLSLSSYIMIGFSWISFMYFLGFISPLLKVFATPHNFVYVGKYTLDGYIPKCRAKRLWSSRPKVAWWSQGTLMHLIQTTCHVELAGHLSRLLVTSRLRDL